MLQVFDEGGLLNNDQIKFYQQMFDQQIAVEATKGRGLGIADMLVRSGGVDVIVIDSVAALTPRAEIEGDFGQFYHGVIEGEE